MVNDLTVMTVIKADLREKAKTKTSARMARIFTD